MSEPPVFGTVTVDKTGVIEDWLPTLNLRLRISQKIVHIADGFGDVTTEVRTVQQLWYDTKSGKQEWRDIPEVRE
jgi:hypothetical protein